MASDKAQIPNPKPQAALRFLGRMDVAAALILLVLLLAAVSSCFPQLSPLVAADVERLERWEMMVRGRYGALADVLAAVGAWRFFRSPIFLAALAALGMATLVCTLQRWRALWRRAFHQRVLCSQAALDGAPYVARLSAPPAVNLPEVVRGRLEERGFRVRTKAVAAEGELIYLRGDRNRLAPLATLLTHLALLLLLAGAAWSSLGGWQEELAVAPAETVEVGHASGLVVRNAGFTLTHYPDGSAAGYQAQVAIVAENGKVTQGTIRVGDPLRHGSVSFLLRGYEGSEGRYSLALLAVHDPGYAPVVTAGLLLLLGMTVSFNFPPCCVRARIEPPGTLCLAGRPDRRAYDFDREFAGLVVELRRALGDAGEGTA